LKKLKYKTKKQKYRFNPDTLAFDVIKNNLKQKIMKSVKFLITGFFFGVIIYLLNSL
jgi:hypothetical protein